MVRLNGQYSEMFISLLGLLTGDPTSPNFWNIFLRMLKLTAWPEDTRLNGKEITKLEQADDLMIAAGSVPSFQYKLNETATQMADLGCEVQESKCEFAVAGVRPNGKLEFTMNGKKLEEVDVMKYVGIHHDFRSKDMYVKHHSVYNAKATTAANMCLGVSRIVGDLPVWDARTLYMARVDPYLTNGADICPDVVEARIVEKEAIQHYYLRRMLGLTARSMTAILFSETGLEPIRYRRVRQLLGYFHHMAVLAEKDPTRLIADGLLDSLDLARQHKISWINDICVVLSKLPIPVYWDLTRADAISVKTADVLLASVKHSMEEYIQASMMSYSKTRDLFADRLELVEKKLVRKVLFFRHYLNVSNEKHRRALTKLLLSGHALASERMTWGERYHPESIPEKWRLCRFCKICIEDPVHALFGCKHEALLVLRREFFARVFHSLPDLKGRYTDAGLFFRDLISRRKTTALLAKYAYDVLEIFYARPMLIINRDIYNQVPT
ncbi:hypothetical protein C8R43DRAFT_880676 [Mycena crocata]|nr:hypothetical protein C8R43DRAFT_881761 [Mycena crocata]KAJ7161301.1 hypothetical protein C8R43DRAFT_880676 [Mycena crocata]